jgi:mitochondrial intermediate peptidase
MEPIDIIEKYTNEYHSLPFVPNTNWHQRFSHFVGYGAKYYSYLVSKAIAAQIWTKCFETDPLSSTAGENYRTKLLAYGGEKPPVELIKSLTGIDVKTTSLVESLTQHF